MGQKLCDRAPRKNPKLFAKAVAESGLPAKVLTNKRGVKKFENTLSEAGVTNFDIRYQLMGSEKADFIKSARIAFHPAQLESYGFSAMETLAAGLPTLLIEEFEWWQAFEGMGVVVCNRNEVVNGLRSLYANGRALNSLRWVQNEVGTVSSWRTLI